MKKIELNSKKSLYILMLVAFIFSISIRLIYLYQVGDNLEFFWNGSYIINTNDGYFFASGAQKELYGMFKFNPLTPDYLREGTIFLTVMLAKILPFSLETIIFFMPIFISSLIVLPIILIGYLYKEPLWGFFSALVASIVWSYYNRTMIGYYDTDMFSIMMLMWIVYYLLKNINSITLETALMASFVISIYPFFYASARVVIYAIVILYSIYIIFKNPKDNNSIKSVILMLIATTPLNIPALATLYSVLIKLAIVSTVYIIFKKIDIKRNILISISAVAFFALLYQGDIFEAIYARVMDYTHKGVAEEGIKFFGTAQTVAEAGKIPFFASGQANSVANRSLGDTIPFIIAIIGYIYLVYKRNEFIIFLPLVGITLFAHWGGLRFTIYGSPILILAFFFLIFDLAREHIKDKIWQLTSVTLVLVALLALNIYHAWNYNRGIGPVFKHSAIAQLDRLKKISNQKDYTLSWWDYGYPIWFYSNTNTLIDGAKHGDDNFIISKILLSTSPNLAANLARYSIEEYDKAINSYNKWLKDGAKESEIPKEYRYEKDGKVEHIGHRAIIDILLKNGMPGQKDPNEFLSKLEDPKFKLPSKSRDIYLYMPTKSIMVFPAVIQFSNLNLATGDQLRDIKFYPSGIRAIKNGIFELANGIQINSKNGATNMGGRINKLIVSSMDQSGDIKLDAYKYDPNSNINLLFMKSMGLAIVIDNETLNSNYVKMFLLGIYDKDLFELVDKSPYGRVYKLKR